MAETLLSKIQKLLCVQLCNTTDCALILHKHFITLTDSHVRDNKHISLNSATLTGLLLAGLGQVGDTRVGAHEDVAGVQVAV